MAVPATVQTSSAIQWSPPQLSSWLQEVLRTAAGEAMAMLPVLSPTEIAEVRQAQRVYEGGLRPTPDETVARFVGALATAYPSHRISAAEAKSKTKLYVRGLHDIPQDALSKGFEDVMKSCTFFPSIAEIREAAAPHFEKRRAALLSCLRLISKHDLEWRPARSEADKPMTEAETAEMNDILARVGAATRFRPDGTRFEEEVAGAPSRGPIGPRRKPTREDYLALGVDPAVLDGTAEAEAAAEFQEERGMVPADGGLNG